MKLMDKESERAFVESFTEALVSLPFDMKGLVEAVVDPDLPVAARETAAAVLIHIFNPKDGHVEAYLRHAEDVVLVRLAFDKIRQDDSEASRDFVDHWPEAFAKLDQELASYRAAFGDEIINWLDGRWPVLRKGLYAKKHAAQYVQDEDLAKKLYDHTSDFITDYPVTETSLAGRVRQLSSFTEHLQRKLEQDKLMIHS